MNYARWNDDELRRVLGANPKDIDAVIEAARRFEVNEYPTADELEKADDKVRELEAALEGAQQSAKEWEQDFEEEQQRNMQLQDQIDTLQDRVTELESSGAGLL